MLNRSASLGMSTSDLEALPCKLDIKRHSCSILYVFDKKMLQLQNANDAESTQKLDHYIIFASLKSKST